MAHPRTVSGICGDGKAIIAVIDGRKPWHSNGATLTDAALLLKAHGAVRGINLDGGGSSTLIVQNEDGELTMLNHPADLHRPTEDLIRDVFNSIIIIKK
jgi:exopolysaccharide biosynthesis protein